ncbi:hypothetical protein BDZ45DRAFT_743976 [Acephala macrosclerotiorum]|nr:hypothetical protein BDZ45DRAFT_743976 [Acephala macrosclerotiorum]
MSDMQVVLRGRPTDNGGLSTAGKSPVVAEPPTERERSDEGKPAKVVPPLSHDLWFIIFVKKLFEAFEHGYFDEEYKESEEQQEQERLRGPHAFYIWLGKMRLVCRDFDDIITPLVYETVKLSSELAVQRLLTSPMRFGATEKMQNHSICLRVTHLYEPEFQRVTHALILGCKRLEYIVWEVGQGRLGEREESEREVARIASTYVDAFIKNPNREWKRIRFMSHRNGFMVEDSPVSWKGRQKEKKLKARRESEYIYTEYPLMTGDPNKYLDLLHLQMSPNRVMSLIPVGVRYPPMKKLKLENYPWTHDREETEQMFDLSKLERLTFNCCDVLYVSSFLAAADHKHLLKIEEFKMTNCWDDEDTEEVMHAELTKLLDGLRGLTYLKLNYEAWEVVLKETAMRNFSYSLRTLELRSGWRCRMLTFRGLEAFISQCTMLQFLSLDLDMTKDQVDVNCFFYYCNQLKHLEILELHGRRTLGMHGVEGDSSDTDYDAAMAIFARCRDKKVGVPYSIIRVELLDATAPPGWRPTPIPAEGQEEGDEEVFLGWGGWRKWESILREDGTVEQNGSEKVGPPDAEDAEGNEGDFGDEGVVGDVDDDFEILDTVTDEGDDDNGTEEENS